MTTTSHTHVDDVISLSNSLTILLCLFCGQLELSPQDRHAQECAALTLGLLLLSRLARTQPPEE